MGLFTKKTPGTADRAATYAFCEPSWATPTSVEHIRQVGAEGLKPGGGVPTPALCGRDLAQGWDLPNSPVTTETVAALASPRPGDGRVFLCTGCATVYAEQAGQGNTPPAYTVEDGRTL